jgi:hypothetical protein
MTYKQNKKMHSVIFLVSQIHKCISTTRFFVDVLNSILQDRHDDRWFAVMNRMFECSCVTIDEECLDIHRFTQWMEDKISLSNPSSYYRNTNGLLPALASLRMGKRPPDKSAGLRPMWHKRQIFGPYIRAPKFFNK